MKLKVEDDSHGPFPDGATTLVVGVADQGEGGADVNFVAEGEAEVGLEVGLGLGAEVFGDEGLADGSSGGGACDQEVAQGAADHPTGGVEIAIAIERGVKAPIGAKSQSTKDAELTVYGPFTVEADGVDAAAIVVGVGVLEAGDDVGGDFVFAFEAGLVALAVESSEGIGAGVEGTEGEGFAHAPIEGDSGSTVAIDGVLNNQGAVGEEAGGEIGAAVVGEAVAIDEVAGGEGGADGDLEVVDGSEAVVELTQAQLVGDFDGAEGSAVGDAAVGAEAVACEGLGEGGGVLAIVAPFELGDELIDSGEAGVEIEAEAGDTGEVGGGAVGEGLADLGMEGGGGGEGLAL